MPSSIQLRKTDLDKKMTKNNQSNATSFNHAHSFGNKITNIYLYNDNKYYSYFPTSNSNSVIQRKLAVCSCDGNCPRCKHESENEKNKDFANIQPKIKVSQPGDAFEQEADRVAEQVVSMESFSDTNNITKKSDECSINRKCKSCKEEEEQEEELIINRKTNSESKFNLMDVSQSIDSLDGNGSPIEMPTRDFMESRFGVDFGRVRIHTDIRAASTAERLNAHAFTIGSDIAFAQKKYAPHTYEGRKLLAHELTHVVQQSNPTHMKNSTNINKKDNLDTTSENIAISESSKIARSIPATQILSRKEVPSTVQVTPPSGPNVCGLEHHRMIFPAAIQAMTWLDRSISLLNSFITTPNATNNNNIAVRNALGRHFHSTALDTANNVLDLLTTIRNNIEHQTPFTVECHDDTDMSCSKYAAYVRRKESKLVFCPSFFTPNDVWRSELIVHEMAHAVVDENIKDRGYVNERVYPLLTTAEALTNAESFGLFVQDLGTGKVTPLNAPRDELEDCPPDWKPLIQNDIAKAQAWNFKASVKLNDKRPDRLSRWLDLQNKYLGATTLAVLNTVQQVYDKVDKKLDSPIEFECEPEGGGRCDDYATYWYGVWSDFHLCPLWKNIRNPHDRALTMLAGLYGYLGDVDNNNVSLNYARLAYELTKRFYSL